MANIVSAMKQYMTPDKPSWSNVLPMTTAEDLTTWEKLDDVIMGGNSSSGLEPAEDGKGAVWKGDLIVEVGALVTDSLILSSFCLSVLLSALKTP